MSGEVFISYRRADQAKAGLLWQLLKDRGVDAWYDAHVPSGEDWRAATANALVAAPIFVLLFSKAAAQSDDIAKELAAATFQKKLVIPVRLEDVSPEGAFLYELASRNWFDAFDDTEARLGVLADRLAALVKGGPDAQAAALKLGAAGASRPAAPTRPKRGLVTLGVVGIIAFAVIAIVAMGLYGPDDDAGGKAAVRAASQRVAFFGFSAADDDAASRNIAATATDEAFSNLGARQVDTIARGEAVVPAGKTRLERAAELGARYALSGEVRRDGPQARFTLRLEDVGARSVLWEATRDGPVNTPTPTAFDAADRAVNLTVCITSTAFTGDTGPRDAQTLSMAAAGCGARITPDGKTRYIQQLREIAAKNVGGPDTQAALAFWLADGLSNASPAAKATMLKEAGDALARAIPARPDSFATAAAQVYLGMARNAPASDWIPPIEAALQRAPRANELYWYSKANMAAGFSMMAAGRLKDATAYFKAAEDADPTATYPAAAGAISLSMTGQTVTDQGESWDEKILKIMHNRPAPFVWEFGLASSVFFGRGDTEALFAAVPKTLQPEIVTCYRNLRAGLKLTAAPARLAAAKKAEACLTQFDSPHMVVQAASLLGDLDAAFAMIDTAEKTNVLTRSYYPPWFSPATRALRADARFLPLMQKLGFVDYWKQSKTQPDVCATLEERDIPLCMMLADGQ